MEALLVTEAAEAQHIINPAVTLVVSLDLTVSMSQFLHIFLFVEVVIHFTGQNLCFLLQLCLSRLLPATQWVFYE